MASIHLSKDTPTEVTVPSGETFRLFASDDKGGLYIEGSDCLPLYAVISDDDDEPDVEASGQWVTVRHA